MSDTLTTPVTAPVTMTGADGAPGAEFDPLAELTLNQMLNDMGDRGPFMVRPMTGKHVGDPGRVMAISDVLDRIGKLDYGWFGPRSAAPSRFLLSRVIQSLLDVAVVPVCIGCTSDGAVVFEIANYAHSDSVSNPTTHTATHTATHTITMSETELTWVYEDEGVPPCLHTFTSPASHQGLTWVLDVAIEGRFAH